MTIPELGRALIVEDDPVVARSVARRLLRQGYSVSVAESCRAGRAAGKGFEVAVLDLDLPDGCGTDLAQELLRLGATRSVVFYTGSIDEQQRERAGRLGSVVDKADDLEQVVAALASASIPAPASQVTSSARQRAAIGSRR